MISEISYLTPYQKIWAAAYNDSKVECIELRTLDKNQALPYYHLWHKEYPIGTAMTDFLYADLSVLEEHLVQVQDHIDEISKSRDIATHFQWLFDMSVYWMNQSPLFAPLAAELQRLYLVWEQGETLTLAPLRSQAAYYQSLQPRLLYLAQNFFSVESDQSMTERYMDLWRGDKENYAPLSYARVFLQEVWRGGVPFSPNLRSFDLTPKQCPPQEFFTTEVICCEEPQDFVDFLLSRYLRENLRWKPCKYCGRYFGATGKMEYCDRLIDGSTKTCKEIGSLRLYEKRKLEDPAIKEYKRSYKAHNARIRYGLMTREEFTTWSAEARKKRDLCVQGTLSLQDFVAWLDSDKM
jgi:hypothetical protein